VIKATFHIIIAFSVYLSSGGFWMSNHYCQNELERTDFFIKWGSCCSSKTESPCSAKKMSCNKEGESDEDKGCCEDNPSFHKLEQNQKTEEIKLKNIEESTSPKISKDYRGYIFPDIDVHSTTHFSYSPPVIITDPQVWFEVFLC
jgi:hypothetical protein